MKQLIPWNEGWKFAFCGDTLPDPTAPVHGADVSLPHTWYRDDAYEQGNAVYQKQFTLSVRAGQHVFLRFDGVDKVCRIYLNGVCVGGHDGAYTRFAVELTNQLRPAENLLTVVVNNEKGETVSPLSGDFTLFGGIYRKVEMLITEENCFDPLFWGTEGVLWRTEIKDGEGIAKAEPHIYGGDTENLAVRYALLDSQGKTVAVSEGKAAETVTLRVPSPDLWDGKKSPALYTARAELFKNSVMLDAVELKVGFRSFSLDADKGFFLNGQHVKLHGVARHQDTAGVFSATTAEHWRRDMELIGEVGANTVRLSHYPHPQAIYDLCDEMGLVVWTEIPMLKMTLNDALLENAKQQLTEMIYQNLHHPSVCFWGIQNEIAIFGEKPWMTDRLLELNALAHQLDPSRLTTSANLNSVPPESSLNRITDAQAYNVYYGWYYGVMPDHAAFLDEFHRVNPGVPLGISEYGVDCNPAFHSADPKVNDYTEEFQCLYHETVYPYMAQRDFVWGSYIWNMFDFVSAIRNAGGVKARNIKGLVTHDRQTKKDAFYYYKAQWSEVPFVHIAEKRFANRTAETMTVKVYSNMKEVTLHCGAVTQTMQSENGIFRFEGILLSAEGTKVTVLSGDCEDTTVFTRVAEPDASYVYVETDAGLNVRNWFVDEAEEARLFPEDAFSLRDKMEDLIENPAVMEVIDRLTPAIGKMIRNTVLSFTLEQAIRYEKPKQTEEEIKALNEALIKIPKP